MCFAPDFCKICRSLALLDFSCWLKIIRPDEGFVINKKTAILNHRGPGPWVLKVSLISISHSTFFIKLIPDVQK